MKVLVIILIGLVQACAYQSGQVVTSPELKMALSGELILGRPVAVNELPQQELLALTPGMERFATDAVKFAQNKSEKAEMLHRALLSSGIYGGLGVRYSAFNTGTAKEVFESAQANCLSYTLLYVALARHLGLNAQVNQVTIPPSWDMNEEKAFFLMRHVNAKIVIRRMSWSFIRDMSRVSDVGDVVVDLEMSRFRANYPQQALDKQSVEALFYNNRAMELSTHGDVENAFLYLRRALEANKNQSFIWSNLGSIYRKKGHFAVAEAVYLHALSMDTGDLTVLHNLAGLYTQLGEKEKSTFYSKKVKNYRNENPYYLYREAVKAKEKGEIEKAKKLITRAIKKETLDERLYLLAAKLSDIQGDSQQAVLLRKKAASLQL